MSLFGWFTGADARSDINKGYKKAKNALATGNAAQNQGYDEAYNMLTPYIQPGTEANTMYYNALGVGGPGAQQAAYNTITGSPFFQNKLNVDNNAMMRSLNARGNSGGAADIAAQRVLYENLDNEMNRLYTAGGRGLQATQMGAGIKTGKADNTMGYYASLGNLDTQRAGSIAGTRNTAMNNLIGLTGALTGVGSAISNYNTGQSAQGYYNALAKYYGNQPPRPV